MRLYTAAGAALARSSGGSVDAGCHTGDWVMKAMVLGVVGVAVAAYVVMFLVVLLGCACRIVVDAKQEASTDSISSCWGWWLRSSCGRCCYSQIQLAACSTMIFSG